MSSMETRSTPVCAISAMLSSVTPPEASSKARPAGERRGPSHRGNVHVIEEDDVCPAVSASFSSANRRRLRLRYAWCAGRRWRAACIGPGDAVRTANGRKVVVLDQDAVGQPETVIVSAAVSDRGSLECAYPGVVFRVSTIRTACRHRGDKRDVAVATPESRCSRFRATRSAAKETPGWTHYGRQAVEDLDRDYRRQRAT